MPSQADTIRSWADPEDTEEDRPYESNFIEQAEYIPHEQFTTLTANHPHVDAIIRRLSGLGAKLLVGPRGCGKSTLMLSCYYQLLESNDNKVLPVYVNYKLSLRLEPLYQSTPNASYWFRIWLNLKIYEGLFKSLLDSARDIPREGIPGKHTIAFAIAAIEAGNAEAIQATDYFTIAGLTSAINVILEHHELNRCVLLLDDAAHAFSPRQQEDFFEFFREIKTREISPKAAIYPGITTHSPTFHVGHDAEQIDAWVRPDSPRYIEFMHSMARKRFGGQLPPSLEYSPEVIEFLAYTSFGIPRSFLNMLRAIYHDEFQQQGTQSIDRRKILRVAKQSLESAHNVYDSLRYKLPAYKKFVISGQHIYQKLIQIIKDYNRIRPDNSQAVEIGLKQPISPEIEKVISFFQYAGLIMYTGENSRGVKGVFHLYMIHFGDLVGSNALIGKRTKNIGSFLTAFRAQTHQVWPRVSLDTIMDERRRTLSFQLVLPHCQVCGAERASEGARFCHNCGAQLKAASIYEELTKQDISVLPLSPRMVDRIKRHSNIRVVRDILIDSDRVKLRSIPLVGPIRAARITNYALEHVS